MGCPVLPWLIFFLLFSKEHSLHDTSVHCSVIKTSGGMINCGVTVLIERFQL